MWLFSFISSLFENDYALFYNVFLTQINYLACSHPHAEHVATIHDLLTILLE